VRCSAGVMACSKVLRESSAVDSPGSLVGWLGWERLRHRGPCPASVPAKAGQRLSSAAWVSVKKVRNEVTL
jgi:hypothetical protein